MTNREFYEKYGFPNLHPDYMTMWDVPAELEIGVIPKRIYCNKDMVAPLTNGFKNLISTGHVEELKTWDGCYNFRPIRGYEKQYAKAMREQNLSMAIKYLSNHSWGGAFDVNAAWNQLGQTPKLSKGFVKCFTDAGFEWGGYWQRKDGMHFQLK